MCSQHFPHYNPMRAIRCLRYLPTQWEGEKCVRSCLNYLWCRVISSYKQILMLASHCPEVDTRWSYECGILNFARNSSLTLKSANQQQKSLRCLPNVTRLHSNTTRMYQGGITKAKRRCDFKYDIYTTVIRRSHDAVRRLHGVVL